VLGPTRCCSRKPNTGTVRCRVENQMLAHSERSGAGVCALQRPGSGAGSVTAPRQDQPGYHAEERARMSHFAEHSTENDNRESERRKQRVETEQDKVQQRLLTIARAAGTFSAVSENNRLSAVRFGADGLVPVVTQESRSGDVLMVAYANRDALDRTLSTGLAHYFSRSRGTLWQKGETSGHVQRVAEVRLDCDGDAVLYRAEQEGPACHTGARTCFLTVISGAAGQRGSGVGEDPGGHVLTRLARTISQRDEHRPRGSYTAELLAAGTGKISQKVGEEAVEVVVAANSEDDERLAAEAADLLYHLLVLLQARGVPLDAVLRELEGREKR
jgi:phosphoribosyl-ATP pyrophosphohydrolase/phosphoribosyl-AMP cyclohydrolase